MSRPVWPWRLAAAEGVATARTGRWASAIVVVVLAWLCAAPGAVDAITVDRLVKGEQAWIAAGAFVYRVQGATTSGLTNPVPAGACDRLAQTDGIDAAFAARRDTTPARTTAAPGGRISLIHVSPGALGFLAAASHPHGVALVTEELAERIGVTDGDPIQLLTTPDGATPADTPTVLTTRVVPTDQLGTDLAGTILVPGAPEERADLCLVRTHPSHAAAVEDLLPSALAWDGTPARATPLLIDSPFTIDYTTAYDTRALRWAWIATAVLAALVWALVQWTRRSYLAIYATFGMPAASRLIMTMTEWITLTALGGLWGWSLGVVGALAAGTTPAQALSQVTWHTTLTLLGASTLVVLIGLRPTGTLLDQLKDR